jgi:TolB-like protein/Flp pilus assembly protein TadD
VRQVSRSLIPERHELNESSVPSRGPRLNSWKEIARYLKRDSRTVQLWEKKEGLPVHRHTHASRSTVHAFTDEIDAWQKSRRAGAEAGAEKEESAPLPATTALTAASLTPARRNRISVLAACALLGVALVAVMVVYTWRANGRRLLAYQHATLAVLPFEDLSASPTEDYVADGLTDDLITALGRSGQLQLISRTSVMRFKGHREPLPRIGQELHASLVLEGTVTYTGKRARITAQLIDAATDQHIWASSYERSFEDVIALQDDVADEVASAVIQKLTGQPETHIVNASRVDPEVRQAYLLGHYFLAKRNEPGIRQAIVYFQQAITKDANYAPGYAGLADCYSLLSVWGSLPPREAFQKAKQAAWRALSLDPNSAEAYTSLAFAAYRDDWDFTGAERYFQKAIQLDPNYVTGHQWYGEFLGDLRRSEQSIAESRKAEELDPLSTIVGCDLADSYMHAGRYQDALDELQRISRMDPNFVPLHSYLANVYEITGRAAMADQELQKYAQLSGEQQDVEMSEIRKLFAAGHRESAKQKLQRFLQEHEKGIRPFYVASLYAEIGEREKAFQALEIAYQEHAWEMVGLLIHPGLATLHEDPRFHDLVRRVGLPVTSRL